MKLARLRHAKGALLLAVLLVFGGALAIVAITATAATAAVNHGQLVPDLARRDVPVVLDGEVRAHAQVGDRIFVGGDFQQVQLTDGSVITQPNIFAYDINTGILDPNFRPVVNNDVLSLETNNTGDGLYAGGRFTRWEVNGVATFPGRVAKLDADGAIDRNFVVGASAVVLDIAHVGNDVYIGGDFVSVDGQPIRGIARVDAANGALDTAFNLGLGNSIAGSQIVRRLDAHPNGNELYVLHYADQVLGQSREAVFKLDISSPAPVLSGWTIPWSAQTNDRNCWNSLRDMAISPDGSFIVIGGQGADNPPNCDSVLRYETAGDAVQPFTWSARMYSSVFSLAVSDVAVYVGGHFCAAPRLGAVYAADVAGDPAGPGLITSNQASTSNGCDLADPTSTVNPSTDAPGRDPVNAVFREQMAALDPVTAQALPWDPGTNASLGVLDLTLTDRGLLAGQDNSRFSNFLVGRSGFFDFGGPADTQPPVLTVTNPAAGLITDSLTSISGTVTDDRGIGLIQLQLRNTTTGLWLQANGTFGPNRVDLPLTTINTGIGQIDWSFPVNNLPPGDYEVRGFANDTSINGSGPLAHPFIVPAAAQCTVALDASDQPVITYVGFLDNGESTVFVRRNNAFLAPTPAPDGTFTDVGVAPGDYDYEIRWRPGGVLTDVACTPALITVPSPAPPPPPPPADVITCVASLDGNGNPVLNWTTLAGVSSYVVREATDGFVAGAGLGTTFTDTGRAPGDYSYMIRYRIAGTVTDVDCTPSPITVGAPTPPPPPPPPAGDACTAVVANGAVTVTWTPIAGEDSYQVRDGTRWVAAVGNVLTFTDNNPLSGTRNYVIRSRQGATLTDVACNSVVVP